MISRISRIKRVMLFSLLLTPICMASTIGGLADSIVGSFENIGKMILGLSFIAGLGFGAAAMFKFKQHKDNPQQNPIGNPITMLLISAALVFLPGFYAPMGATMGLSENKAGGYEGDGIKTMPGAGEFGSHD